MDQHDPPPSRRTLIACGALAAAAGGYVILISLGVVPPPGEKNPHAPHWLVFCAGLAFVLAGVALAVRACAGDPRPGAELPPDAPRWLHATQYLLVMAIIACFAAIGSFIAFAPGPRSFGISLPFMEMRGGAVIGRIAFGIGAVILWLCLIGFAVSGARKLIGRRKV